MQALDRPADHLDRITTAVGGLGRVAYEAVHVYPLSAPAFTASPGALRERPTPGPYKLYVHVPFCNYACGFCFYVKRVGSGPDEMARYVAALETELRWVEPGTPLEQLYIGGGTPTALPPDLLDRVLAAVHARFVPQGASMTVECSPESVTAAHVDVLRARGVDRVSMGIESLETAVLDTITRRHGGAEALDACDLLVGSGLRVNVDLIYGLPGQTHASFVADVDKVVSRGVHSVSVYNLRLNERTPVSRALGELERMDLPRLVRWREVVERALVERGFRQRRWHTFDRVDAGASTFHRAPCGEGFGEGRQLGVGVSAVSHLGHTITRNDEKFRGYLQRVEAGESPVAERFDLDPDDRRTLLVARTLGDGGALDRVEYADAVGRTVDDDFGEVVARLVAAGLVRDDGARVTLSDDGRLVYDLVTLAFYPEAARAWLASRQPSA